MVATVKYGLHLGMEILHIVENLLSDYHSTVPASVTISQSVQVHNQKRKREEEAWATAPALARKLQGVSI
jgi:hypothetical protein